jgi:cyclopropane-fatty-acyl-phospholipid synthase
LLDIGCGWGTLAIWAATHYGVRAHGITLSTNQAAEATRRVAAAGVADRVTIDQRHYATLPARAYDKVASIGMYEHVGIAHLPAYFGTVNTLLRPGGLFLNHGITAPARRSARNGGTFIGRHVFPGGEIDGLPHLAALMEQEGFEIVDVESLRQHYALTLAHWFRRFQAARGRAASFVPERVLRTWDLYLAGCAQAFAEGTAGIHQVLAAKPDQDGRAAIPLTRNDLLV